MMIFAFEIHKKISRGMVFFFKFRIALLRVKCIALTRAVLLQYPMCVAREHTESVCRMAADCLCGDFMFCPRVR